MTAKRSAGRTPDETVIEHGKVTELIPDTHNANTHTVRGRAMHEDSIRKLGIGRGIVVDKNKKLIGGNQTTEIVNEVGLDDAIFVHTNGDKLVVTVRDDLDLEKDKAARELAYFDNRTSEVSLAWNPEQLLADIADGVDLSGLFDADELDALLAGTRDEPPGDSVTPEQARKTLAERFIVPPFSVLDARQGYWQERKRAWIALGIQSEIGRGMTEDSQNDSSDYGGYSPNFAKGSNLLGLSTQAEEYRQSKNNYARTYGSGGPGTMDAQRKAWRNEDSARVDTSREWVNEHGISGNAGNQSGTSIFDPVLCELAYRWFCPPNGNVIDPFAGGSVRGVVASKLNRNYTGVDLRPEQIAANEAQAKSITPDKLPRWIVGDSRNIKTIAAAQYDFVFSCPPYFDLEIYSDEKADLSNAGDYEAFLEGYRLIIRQAVDMLKDNRFACFVVGDIRDKRGMYRNFVSETIDAFQIAGAALYNEAILVTQVGSLPIRVGKQFTSGRKLGKTHQNVLVFVKGDPGKAVADIGAVECGDVTAPERAEA